MARKMQKYCTKGFNLDNRTVVFDWADGTQDVVALEDLPQEMREHAMYHGLLQKFGDSYASAESLADAKLRFAGVVSQVKAGDWNRRSGGGGVAGGLWIEAVARVTGQDAATVRTMWEGLTEEQRKAVKADPRVKKAKAEIDLERATQGGSGTVDLQGMFGEEE